MADSDRTGQRLLDSIRKAKTGEEVPGPDNAAKAAGHQARPAQPARKTQARKTSARKTTARKMAATKATTRRARPSARGDRPVEDDPFRSPGRVWPD